VVGDEADLSRPRELVQTAHSDAYSEASEEMETVPGNNALYVVLLVPITSEETEEGERYEEEVREGKREPEVQNKGHCPH
jgi:hypothetical protein